MSILVVFIGCRYSILSIQVRCYKQVKSNIRISELFQGSDRHSFPRTLSSLPRELGLVQMQLLLLLQGKAKLERESAGLLVSQFQSHKD